MERNRLIEDGKACDAVRKARVRLAPVAALLLSAFLVSGCAVGPDFVKPEAPVSRNWIDAGDPRVKTGPARYKEWWKAFNDPFLDGLIDRAYRDNLSLRVAGVRVLEARAILGIAVGRLYPQTQQATGAVQDIRLSDRYPLGALLQSPVIPHSLSSSLFNYWQDQVGLNASWEIDFWGRFRRNIESADASLAASVADYDSALVSLTADVTNSYIMIRTIEKRLAIARKNVEVQRESLLVAQERLMHGRASRLDTEQAKTALSDTLASIPTLETQLRQAENGLCVLLGLPPGDLAQELKAPSEIPVSPPEIVVGIPNDLLRRRPDVRSAEYQAAAQSAQIGVAKADLYPAFSLSGMFGFLSSDVNNFSLGDMFAWKSRNYQFGPSVQWSIFNYGRIRNNVRAQDARFEELLITYRNTVLKAQREVEDALVAFLKAQERAAHLRAGTEAAKSALDMVVEQYREGIRDFTAVLLAQQALLNEQDSLAVTLGNLSSNLVAVYRGLGGGWEIREGRELFPPDVKEEMAKRTDWGKLLDPAAYAKPAWEAKSPVRLPDW